MSNLISWVVLFIFLFHFVDPTSGLTINNYEIRDLESTTSSLATEASLWTVQGNFTSTITSQCSGTYILGGYQITGNGGQFTRTYTSLPSHNLIYFSVFMWLIDTQESADLFQIYFDGSLVRDWNSYGYSFTAYPAPSLCGGGLADYTNILVEGKVAHSASTLTFKLVSMYNSASNSFQVGFRNLNLLFQTTTSTPSTATCAFTSTGDTSVSSCLCASNQYDPVGSSGCSSCNSVCKTCSGGANTDCTSCPSGSSYNGQKCYLCDPSCLQCNGTTSTDCVRCASGKYLYWNGTCQSSCMTPLVATIDDPYQSCSLPCPIGEYYYQNGTCGTTCASPFTQSSQGDLLYCNFPCSSLNYLYSNGSCLSSCSSPFTSVTKGVERYCQSPCSSSSLYYFANNNTCGANCNSPFTSSTSGVLKSCNSPCSTSQYLYWNNTCQTTCPSPLIGTSAGSYLFCNLPCPIGEYYYQNGTCGTTCASPFTQSSQGDLLYCNFPCSSLNYLYSNGSCLTCASPFTSISKGTERYCQSPCSSSSLQYYPKNNTCSSTCSSPYIQYTEGVISYCVFPCSTSSDYLYWNGSCSSFCPTSFQQVRYGDNYCEFYCDIPNYLDSANQVCKSSCPAPLVSSADAQSYKSCDLPCSPGQYFFPNGSCLLSCPYQIRVGLDGVTYCDYPCSASLYQYQNNSCLETCNSPYLVHVVDSYFSQCYSPCLSGQFYVEKSGSCISSCNSPSIIVQSGVLKICSPSTSTQSDVTDQTSLGSVVDGILAGVNIAGSLIRPNDQNSAFVVALAKLIKYVQYIDVPLLESVRESLSPGASSGFTITQMFSFNMPESLQSKFPSRSLPGFLGHGGLHSSYLVNHWTTITTYIFLSGLGFLFFFVDKMIQKTSKKTLKLISRRMRILLKWNFFLFAFFNTYDDLTYFATLELRTLHFSSAAEILSFLVCIFTSIYAIYMLVKAFLVCRGALNVKKQVAHVNGISPEKQFYNKHESYQVLYAGLRDDSLLAKNYLFIFTIRIIICYLIISFLYEHPLIQSVQLTFMSLLMWIYLIKCRPIKDPYNVVVNWTYEILLGLANICLTLLAIYDATGKMTADIQYALSRCILIANNLINMCSSIFSYGYLIMGAWYAYKMSKSSGEDAKTAWVIVPSSPYSNPGMDFDDLSYDEVADLSPEKKLIENKNMSRMRRLISKNARQDNRFAIPKPGIFENTPETKLVSESSANGLFRRSSNNYNVTSMNNFGSNDLDVEKRRSSLSIVSSPSNHPLKISDQLGLSTPVSETSSQDYINLNIHSPIVIGKRSKKIQGFEEVLSDYLNKNAGLILEENTLEDMATDRNKKGLSGQSDLDMTGSNSRFGDSFNRTPSLIQNPTHRSNARLIHPGRKDSLIVSSGRRETDFGISLERQSSSPKKEKRKNIKRSRILPGGSEITLHPQNSLLSILNPKKKDKLDSQVYETSLNITRENNAIKIQAKKNRIYDRLRAKGVIFDNSGTGNGSGVL